MKNSKEEIVIHKDWDFPITLKVVDKHSRIEKIYQLVKTKSSGFMLQK